MPEAACRLLAGAPRPRWDVAPLDQLGARISRAARAVLRGEAGVRGAAA
jgi:hypothetical protein